MTAPAITMVYLGCLSRWLQSSSYLLLLPFPISFVVSLIIIFSLAIVRANLMLKKTGIGGIKGWSEPYSSYKSGRGWGTGDKYKPLTFYCMLCGYPHKNIACPKCGSKAVRAN